MVSVRVGNIWKSYGKEEVLRSLSFTVSDGELMVILGPSGVGKTTTLKIIAGLIPPDKGRIYFDGRDVTHLPASERNVGFVFQSLALFPHMTVWDNIAFGLDVRGWETDEIRERVKYLIDLLGLNGLENRYPRELSGGQQQRVAIARALAPEPQLLLLDEPFANLDALLRDRMRWELKKIQRELKITTIFVTHDQEEAFQIADKVAVLLNGKIAQIGTPSEIYNNPKNEEIAKFLGINIINISKLSNKYHFPCKTRNKKILVWPEEIELGSKGIPAIVKSIANLKGFLRIIFELPEKQEIEAIINADTEIRVGTKVHINIKQCKPI